MKKITSSIVAALAMSTFAFAGGDIAPVEPKVTVPEVVESTPGSFYVGLGYSYVTADYTWDYFGATAPGATSGGVPYNGEITSDAVLFLAGYNFNKYIGVEGRYTMSVGDPTEDDGLNPEADINVDISNIAAYLKLMYPLGDKFNVYGLLGYGQTTFDGSTEESESGFQWGIGANYALTDNFGLFVDYTRMYDDSSDFDNTGFYDMTVDSWNFGVTYTF